MSSEVAPTPSEAAEGAPEVASTEATLQVVPVEVAFVDSEEEFPVLRHMCEVCGKDENLSPAAAFDAGWDYPPRMGAFGVLSPRTCGNCGIQDTVWWALMSEGKSVSGLTSKQLEVVRRIQGEPLTILPIER